MKTSLHRNLFIGPMSIAAVDSVKDSDFRKKVGLIPSRRQVEYSGGYVNGWTTSEFLKYTRGVVRCRDHAGPWQGESSDDGLTSLSIDCDINNHFEIIHIDPWKKERSIESVAVATCDLIKHCANKNNSVLFEVGTEQGIRPYSTEELDKFLSIIEKGLGNLFERILYCVIQGGTGLLSTNNTGTLDEAKCSSMIYLCHNRGLLSKEHNGDYLGDFELSRRFQLGLDAINIAPQIGVIETTAILDRIIPDQFEKIYEICYLSNKWKKWFVNGYEPCTLEEKIALVKASCHYCFSHPKIVDIKREINVDSASIIELHRKFLLSKFNLIDRISNG